MKHISQNENDCALACMAMLSNKTLEEIHQLYPEFNGIGVTTEEILYLLRLLKIEYILYATPRMIYGRLYLVSVPSLNNKGSHSVIVDLRDWEVSEEDPNVIVGCCLYDPNQKNNIGRESYSYKDLPLKVFYEVFEILTFND